ncbi:MAG: hypothetical protein ABI859_16850 [Pseudomonadota bacterium]
MENREPPPAVNHQADWNAWDLVKAAYPKFSGRQDWLQPQHYAQRIVDSGDATWAQLEAGVKRYAAYVEAGGVSSTSHVLAPVKFFSAADRPWSQAWEPPTSLASRGKPPLKLRTSAEIEAEENARAER